MDPLIIGGRYEVLRRLGQGGVADVYLARDRVLDRQGAVKVLRPEVAADAAYVERFRREARAIAGLNHPHVVSVYDWGKDEGGRPYMVMENVPGGTLEDMLVQRGPLPEDDARRLAGQIASALAAAHRAGIVHRDIKPQNVLLTADGEVRVADFGIARQAGATTLTGPQLMVGTAHYISPEGARGGPVDERSDIYSLGAVLYQMLTGHAPFEAESALGLALKHINDPVPSPRTLRPDVAPDLEATVVQALAKDPAERFQSAEALRAVLPGSVQMATEIVTPPAVERRRVTPLLPAGLAAVVAALVAVFVLARPHGPAHGSGPSRVAAAPTATSRPAPPTRAPTTAPTSAPSPTSTPLPPTVPPTSAPPPAVAPPATTAPATVPPTSVPVPIASSGAATPVAAVEDFYSLVNQRAYAAAANLWTPGMQARNPPASAIDRRFAGTQSITVQRIWLDGENSSAGTATVGVVVVEVQSGGTITWVGTWNLAHLNGGWLLAAPNLQQAAAPAAGHGPADGGPPHGPPPGRGRGKH